MIVHRLRHPIDRPGVKLSAVTLRRPARADHYAIIAEVERAGATSNISRTVFLIAQLSGLPLPAVRALSRADARSLAADALQLFKDEGLI